MMNPVAFIKQLINPETGQSSTLASRPDGLLQAGVEEVQSII